MSILTGVRTITGIPLDATALDFRARDISGAVIATTTVTFPTDAPQWTELPTMTPLYPAPGQQVTLTLGVASGTPAPTLTPVLLLDLDNVTAQIVDGVYTVPADAPHGVQLAYTVNAINASGTIAAGMIGEVRHVAPVAANALSDLTLTVGVAMTPVNVAADFTGTPAPTVALHSGMLPPGLSFASGVLSGTPTTAAAATTLVFRATNGAGTADTAFEVTVENLAVIGQFQADDWLLLDQGSADGVAQRPPKVVVLRPPSGLTSYDIQQVVISLDSGPWLQLDDPCLCPGSAIFNDAHYTTGVARSVRIGAVSAVTGQVIAETISAAKSVTATLTVINPLRVQNTLPTPAMFEAVPAGSGALRFRLTSAGKAHMTANSFAFWHVRDDDKAKAVDRLLGGIDDEPIVTGLPNDIPWEVNLGMSDGLRAAADSGSDIWGDPIIVAPVGTGSEPPGFIEPDTISIAPTGRAFEIAVEVGIPPSGNGSALTKWQYRYAAEDRASGPFGANVADELGEIGTWSNWIDMATVPQGAVAKVAMPGAGRYFIQFAAVNAYGRGRACHPVWIDTTPRAYPASFALGALNTAGNGGEWVRPTATSISSVSAGVVGDWQIVDGMVQPTKAAGAMTLPCTITFNDASTLTCTGLAADTFRVTADVAPPAMDLNGKTWEVVPLGTGRPYRTARNWLNSRTAPAGGTPLVVKGADAAFPAELESFLVPSGMANVHGRAGIRVVFDAQARRLRGDSLNAGLLTLAGSSNCDFLDWELTGRTPRERDTDGLSKPVPDSFSGGEMRGTGHTIRYSDPNKVNVYDVWYGIWIKQSGNSIISAHARRFYADPFPMQTPALADNAITNCTAADPVAGGASGIHPDLLCHVQDNGTNSVLRCEIVGNVTITGIEAPLAPPFIPTGGVYRTNVAGVSSYTLTPGRCPGAVGVEPMNTDTIIQLEPAAGYVQIDRNPAAPTKAAPFTLWRGRGGTGKVIVRPASGETIDGLAEVEFTRPGQGHAFTPLAGVGWSLSPGTAGVSLNNLIVNGNPPSLEAEDSLVACNICHVPASSWGFGWASNNPHRRGAIVHNIGINPEPAINLKGFGVIDEMEGFAALPGGFKARMANAEATCGIAGNVLNNLSTPENAEVWTTSNFALPRAAMPAPSYSTNLQGVNGDGTGFYPRSRAQAIAAARPRSGSPLALSGAGPLGVTSATDLWDYVTGQPIARTTGIFASLPEAGATSAPPPLLWIETTRAVKASGSGTARILVGGVEQACTVIVSPGRVTFTPTGTLPDGAAVIEISAGYLTDLLTGASVGALSVSFTVSSNVPKNFFAYAHSAYTPGQWVTVTTYSGVHRWDSRTAAHWSSWGVPASETVIFSVTLRPNSGNPSKSDDINFKTGAATYGFRVNGNFGGGFTGLTRATDDTDPTTGDYGRFAHDDGWRFWVKVTAPTAGTTWILDFPDKTETAFDAKDPQLSNSAVLPI